MELYISSPYTPSWCGKGQLYLFLFVKVNIQQHQMSQPSGSTPALYSGGLTLGLLFGEQV